MAALMRLVGPAVARYFGPGPDDMIDTFFDGTPMPVTVEVYPFSPATRITGQKLAINGVSREFARVSGQNPATLQFFLGGDASETAGGINTVSLSVTDDTGGTTHFSLRYFRVAHEEPKGTATKGPITTGIQVRRMPATLVGAASR
jgi:hypothetical protein